MVSLQCLDMYKDSEGTGQSWESLSNTNLLTRGFPVESRMLNASHCYRGFFFFSFNLEQAKYCENICGEYLVVLSYVSIWLYPWP